MHIGICGTFDVQNYGDLLFPLIAESELSRRLGPITLHRFSYHGKAAPDWPYDVASVTELPVLAGQLDGMLIGGGHLIRFDKEVAPGYHPPTSDIHHPTGYWLGPALTCLQHGCPVAWNAPGAYKDVPSWAEPLMNLAFSHSRYIAVRDDEARTTLMPFVNGHDIAVVPDTCFGVARLLQQRRPAAAPPDQAGSLDPTRPYIIVQATRGLDAFLRLVADHPERFAGYQFLALPAGAVLGDDAALLGNALPGLVTLPEYPHPERIAALVAGAAGIVGVSLHLAMTAAAFGVPVIRPDHAYVGKYAVLSSFDNVHAYAANAPIDPDWFAARLAQRGIARQMTDVLGRLDRHWDMVASCFSAGRDSAGPRVGSLWQILPSLLEGDGRIAELERLLAERDQQHDAALAERQQQVAQRDAAIAARERQIAGVTAALDRARGGIALRDREVDAFRNSKSWKMTAPLRWIGDVLRGTGTPRPQILNLDRIAHQPLATEPFEWAFANELFSRRAAKSLARTYPRDHFKTVKGYDGEKGYEYEARALIHMNATSAAFAEDLSDPWQKLALDLLSPAYRAAMMRLTNRDLSNAWMEAYVCHFGPGAWLGPHLDLKDKILTQVFYFNKRWDAENGGCLSILRSKDMSDVFAEVPPVVGNSSVVVRSENSWHSVSRVTNGSRTSRRSMNVIFYHPGAVSTMWPPGEKAALHRYKVPRNAA